MPLSTKLAVERTEYPCSRTIAKAARLNIAKATMISSKVKPLRCSWDLTNNADIPGCRQRKRHRNIVMLDNDISGAGGHASAVKRNAHLARA